MVRICRPTTRGGRDGDVPLADVGAGHPRRGADGGDVSGGGGSDARTGADHRGLRARRRAGRRLGAAVVDGRRSGSPAGRSYWVTTTRADGRPHAMPVWGLWLDGALWFSSDPDSVKGRNLAARPDAVVHLESGDEVCILDGRVRRVGHEELPADFVAGVRGEVRHRARRDASRRSASTSWMPAPRSPGARSTTRRAPPAGRSPDRGGHDDHRRPHADLLRRPDRHTCVPARRVAVAVRRGRTVRRRLADLRDRSRRDGRAPDARGARRAGVRVAAPPRDLADVRRHRGDAAPSSRHAARRSRPTSWTAGSGSRAWSTFPAPIRSCCTSRATRPRSTCRRSARGRRRRDVSRAT